MTKKTYKVGDVIIHTANENRMKVTQVPCGKDGVECEWIDGYLKGRRDVFPLKVIRQYTAADEKRFGENK